MKKVQKTYYSPSVEGFYGAFYECPVPSEKAVILMIGDAVDDRTAVSGVKWLHQQGCHVMAMSPDKKDYGHHNYPLERFGKAIGILQERGCSKIGMIGASTTGMLALVAASYYPQISLTVAISPPDFVMEGFYQDGKDGMRERRETENPQSAGRAYRCRTCLMLTGIRSTGRRSGETQRQAGI